VYIGWGEKCLEEVIARFEDGEAELLVDSAFADFIYEFPRMQALAEAAFLRQKIGRLEQEQGTVFPHRLPRFGTANAKERAQTALHIPSLFEQQDPWLETVRAIRFDTIPDATSIPSMLRAKPPCRFSWWYICSAAGEGPLTFMPSWKSLRTGRAIESKF
jgi:hypothetical protein